MKPIMFEIPGIPAAKGRPRFARRGDSVSTYKPAKTTSYENLVKLCYTAKAIGLKPHEGGVKMSIACLFPIPKSTSKKQRLEIGCHPAYLKKPDVDNLIKIILDALNGIAYRDDKQVYSVTCKKYYSETPRTTVEMEFI
jgi:Holliday junction resolvase RusA-like endonuclease